MSFYMWLFAVKSLGRSYPKAIKRYRKLPSEKRWQLYKEFHKL